MTITNKKSLGLYIHIPFCVQKCNYCDFLSFGGSSLQTQEEYVESLVSEIKYYGKRFKNSHIVDSVFFGGGTPSLISGEFIEKIIICVKDEFNVFAEMEITIEANPGTLRSEKLNTYLRSGINRLSIGAQALDDNMLTSLGRIHRVCDFLENYKLARKAGFTNINIDLMFAIPQHSMTLWEESLRMAIELAPEHISFYSLQLEEGTEFFKLYEQGKLDQPSDHEDRAMYHRAVEMFTAAGYEHYEISNMAKPGYRCRHNIKYWSMEEYLGLGLGAHSYISGKRFSNSVDMGNYLETASKEKSAVVWEYDNKTHDNMSEYVFTGLRQLDGICLADFKARLGVDFFDAYREKIAVINKYIDQGYLISKDGYLKLTLNGIDISNSIMSEFV